MNKKALLTKHLIKDVIILSLILVIFGGATGYAYYYIESQTKRQQDVSSNIDQMNGKIVLIKSNYEKANVSIDVYKEISDKLEAGELQTDDKALRETLLSLKEKFRLSQLNLKLEPDVAYRGNSLIANNSVVGVKYRSVELRLGAMSDIHIYSFVGFLLGELSGIVKVEDFSIRREKNISKEALFRISNGAIPQAVTAQLKFFWVDLKEKT